MRRFPKSTAAFALVLLAAPALADHFDDLGAWLDVVSDITPVNAVSGLASVRGEPNGNGHDDEIAMWSVGDRAIVPSRIYGLTVDEDAVSIVSELFLTLDGQSVAYDIEGIDVDTAGGWWLVVEGGGNAPNATSPNLLLRVDSAGAITGSVALPPSVAAQQKSNGLEGVAVNDDGSEIYVAFQNEWDDPAGLLRIGRYTPASGEWAFYHYPRESGGPGRVGLSEITWAGDDTLVVVERDNLESDTGMWNKRLYAFSVEGVEPAPVGATPPVLEKWLLRDLLAVDGWPHEKAEGVAIVDKDIIVVNDNDGVIGMPTDALVLDKLAPALD